LVLVQYDVRAVVRALISHTCVMDKLAVLGLFGATTYIVLQFHRIADNNPPIPVRREGSGSQAVGTQRIPAG